MEVKAEDAEPEQKNAAGVVETGDAAENANTSAAGGPEVPAHDRWETEDPASQDPNELGADYGTQ